MTRADRDALREAPADAARDQQVADLDLVACARHVLDAHAGTSRSSPVAAHEAARAGALDDHVDAEAAVHRQPHVDLVAGDALDTVPTVPSGEITGMFGRDAGVRRVERCRCATRKNSVVFLPMTTRAHRLVRHGIAQVEQAPQPAILGLERAPARCTRSRSRAFSYGQPVVVGLDVDQVHVLADQRSEIAASDAAAETYSSGRRDAQHSCRSSRRACSLRVAHARAQEEERHRQRAAPR